MEDQKIVEKKENHPDKDLEPKKIDLRRKLNKNQPQKQNIQIFLNINPNTLKNDILNADKLGNVVKEIIPESIITKETKIKKN